MKTKLHALALSALLATATGLVLAATEEAAAPAEPQIAEVLRPVPGRRRGGFREDPHLAQGIHRR